MQSRYFRPRLWMRVFALHFVWLLLVGCATEGEGRGVTDPPKPDLAIASIEVSPAGSTVKPGKALQLTARAKNRAGNVLEGKTFTWSSSADSIASVDASGLVNGKAPGPATITAKSEGQTGSVPITVVVPSARRLVLSPQFSVLEVGRSRTLAPTVLDADGDTLRNAHVSWSSLSGSVASVSPQGSITAESPGQTKIVAQVNSTADTAVVVVRGRGSIYSTAFAGGTLMTEVQPGQMIALPAILDLSNVSPTGDLGAVEFDLSYDSNVLQYESATAALRGAASYNVPTPGTFKFSFAGTDPQGTGALTLVTISFRVNSGAPLGMQRVLDLTYTARPLDTRFSAYENPITVDGKIHVGTR